MVASLPLVESTQTRREETAGGRLATATTVSALGHEPSIATAVTNHIALELEEI
jgi:hypothetical protein